MLPTPRKSPSASLYLVTPVLSGADGGAFARTFAETLKAAPVASALVRLGSLGQTDAKGIVAPLLRAAVAADCALLIENDARLAARLGVDGVHVDGRGGELKTAIESLKPERIVGAGSLITRDEAMNAGEMGADYLMFGEPVRGRPMGLEPLIERVGWWAEIFETPCVAYAATLEAARALAEAGADFVALGDAVWESASPAETVRQAHALLARSGANVP